MLSLIDTASRHVEANLERLRVELLEELYSTDRAALLSLPSIRYNVPKADDVKKNRRY